MKRPNRADWLTRLRVASLTLRPHSWQAFAVVLVCLIAATLLRLAFGWAGTSLPFATYYPAVLAATLFAGIAAGSLTIAGSIVLGWWAFVPPFFEFGPLGRDQLADIILFALSSGAVLAIAYAFREVAGRLDQQDRRQTLIVQEMLHRSRNTFAVLEAIVRQVLEGDPKRAEALVGSIRAVMHTNELIASSDGASIDLATLIREEFAPFGEQRLQAEGRVLTLQPATARLLVLVVHELVTNAAKHGALATGAGRVHARWSVDGDNVTLAWREEGGPPVSPPEQHNFGSRLVVRCLRALSGHIEADFAPEGLRCTIRFKAT